MLAFLEFSTSPAFSFRQSLNTQALEFFSFPLLQFQQTEKLVKNIRIDWNFYKEYYFLISIQI